MCVRDTKKAQPKLRNTSNANRLKRKFTNISFNVSQLLLLDQDETSGVKEINDLIGHTV